jgi:hypothetical protein
MPERPESVDLKYTVRVLTAASGLNARIFTLLVQYGNGFINHDYLQ